MPRINTRVSSYLASWCVTVHVVKYTRCFSLQGVDPYSGIPNMTYVVDYKHEDPDFSVFDVSACYNSTQQRRLVFSLPSKKIIVKIVVKK